MQRTILIFNPGTEGGIPVYAHFQAGALGEVGWRVIELCDRKAAFKPWPQVESLEILFPDRKSNRSIAQPLGRKVARFLRIMGLVSRLFANQFQLLVGIWRYRPNAVLLASYTEYLSPVWAPMQWLVSKICRTPVMACLHDPVRDFRIGPDWWHALSVRMAYSPLSAVFVHDPLPPEAGVPSHVRSAIVPHGLFEGSDQPTRPETIRAGWGVPDDSVVFLSLGFIRDGKNLDLVIRAMAKTPPAYLVVMGRVQSESNNRPLGYYEELAKDLGVADRVCFREAFVPEEELTSNFAAADIIVMTYSGDFRSQSGVLNVAAHAGRPLLLSCGEGPLKNCALRFQLGVYIDPDDQETLDQGMQEAALLARKLKDGYYPEPNDPSLDWAGYREFASWKTNASVITATYEAIISECRESA